MEDEEQRPIEPLLLLYSHARTHPISYPDLKYDLRSVSNPPKQIRDKYTGVDKRLQEHMRSHGDFVSFVERAEAEIKTKMAAAVEEFKALPARSRSNGRWARDSKPTANGIRVDDEESGDGDEEDDEDDDDEDRPKLRVSAFCVRGRHRSVAFVEELAAREWPKDWEVRVVHRDLGRSRKESSSKGPGRRGSDLGRGFLGSDDE